jgi:putative oxidoreductase
MAVPYTIEQARVGWNDNGKLILRVTVAVLMLMHGIAKMQNGIGWMAGMLQSHHLPAFVGYGVYVGEVIAPILLLLGLFTRLAALVVAFDMVMAIGLAESDKIFTRSQSGGWAIELEMFYLLASVAIFFLGSGRYAVRKGQHRWD